jgi:predicted HicB family RNase H-like nuclease
MKNVLTYKGFIGTVGYSAEDHLFLGKIDGIEDLVTFEGETVSELEAAFRYMVDQHIADCEAEGKPAEKSYKGVLNIRISPNLHKKAAQSAMVKGITLNQMIRQALEKELQKIP